MRESLLSGAGSCGRVGAESQSGMQGESSEGARASADGGSSARTSGDGCRRSFRLDLRRWERRAEGRGRRGDLLECGSSAEVVGARVASRRHGKDEDAALGGGRTLVEVFGLLVDLQTLCHPVRQ